MSKSNNHPNAAASRTFTIGGHLVPYFPFEALTADRLVAKIVVDATNYYAGWDGQVDFADLAPSELPPGVSPAHK